MSSKNNFYNWTKVGMKLGSRNAVYLIFLTLSFLFLLTREGRSLTGFTLDEPNQSYNSMQSDQKKVKRLMYLSELLAMRQAIAPVKTTLISPPNNSVFQKSLLRGVLITYHSYRATSVAIGGNFNNWEKQPLHRNAFGVWYTILPPMNDKKELVYRLFVDGFWISNPMGPVQNDPQWGGEVSVFLFDFQHEKKRIRTKIQPDGSVRFQIFLPEAKRVSVAGSFNNWNMWHNFLNRQADGSWHLTLRLPPGKYHYRFYVDDNWKLDLYNPVTEQDSNGDLTSVILVPR